MTDSINRAPGAPHDLAEVFASSPFRTFYAPSGAVVGGGCEAFLWVHRRRVPPEDVAYLVEAIHVALEVGRVFFLLFQHRAPRDRLKRDLRAKGLRVMRQGTLQ